jgi:hypothetical protein
MSHYARVNNDNIVTYVTPIPDEMITDENGIVYEDRALSHLYSTIPDSVGDRWIRTSYDGNFRVRYAGIGHTWNEELNAFISPKPHESWVLNETTADWEAPIPMPEITEENKNYVWNEELGTWKAIQVTGI